MNEKTEVIFTKVERLQRSAVWAVVSTAVTAWLLYQLGSLDTLWLGDNHWLGAILFGLILVPTFVIFMVRSKWVSMPLESKSLPSTVSPNVSHKGTWFSAEPIDVPDMGTTGIHESVELSLWFRYPLALLCFWIAFLLFANVEDIRNALRIPAALTFVCLGFYLAREVMLWVAGLALVGLTIWGLIAGFAALTVPAAIVVGSLIIAFAISR